MKSITQYIVLLFGCLLILVACNRKSSQAATSNTNSDKEKQEKAMADKKEIVEVAASNDIPEKEVVPLRATTNPDTVLSMETTACYGKCPVYVATLMSDGTLYYWGRKFVDHTGRYKAKISVKKVRDIDQKLQAIDILNKADHYPEDGKDILDVSNTILTVEFKGQRKKIHINHAAPVELQNFISELEKFFDGINWLPAGPKD